MANVAARKAIEKMVIDTFKILDKSGTNVEIFKKRIASKTDAEFDAFMKLMRDEKEWFTIEMQPYHNEPTLNDIKEAADFLKIPLDEYIYYRHIKTSDGEPIRSRAKVPVGFTHIRRLQQVVTKKNSYTADIGSRSQMSGQVSNDSKIARMSDNETSAFIVMGGTNILKEMLGARADNKEAKQNMYSAIDRYGYANLKESPEKTNESNVVLNTIDVNFIAAGVKTNLISDTYVLNKKKI